MSNHPRSIFGPLLLITVGGILFLTQTGSLPTANLWALTHIWPYVIIAAGVGLILRSYWRYANLLLDICIVSGAVLSIVYAPQLGWDNPYMGFVYVGQGVHIGQSEPGSGKMITEMRDISDFNELTLEYPAQVMITQGESVSVKIEAEDNILPGLQTRVSNNRLEIFYKADDGKYVRPTKNVRIMVVVKNLNFSSSGDLTINRLATDSLDISLSGAGELKVNDITAQRFNVELSGAGSITADGKVEEFRLNISGFGSFSGNNLQTQIADVDLNGTGGATIWVEKQLDVTISGAGSVNYYGTPYVSKQVNGIGIVSESGSK